MILVAVIAVVLLGLVLVLNAFFPGVLGEEGNQMSLTHSVLWLVLLGSSLVLGYRGRARAAMKHALAWIGVAALLVLGYSYRDDFFRVIGRVGGELMPGMPTVTASGDVELRASKNGHFQADARINGAKVRLLVDTGATMLALAPGDAKRIGFDLDALSFDRVVNTANGTTRVALVRLNQIEIGPLRFTDIGATVHRDGLDQSLLGMNVLDRLSSFERRGGTLTLRP